MGCCVRGDLYPIELRSNISKRSYMESEGYIDKKLFKNIKIILAIFGMM